MHNISWTNQQYYRVVQWLHIHSHLDDGVCVRVQLEYFNYYNLRIQGPNPLCEKLNTHPLTENPPPWL